MKKILLTILTLIILFAGNAWADNHYVKTGGSDTGTCTEVAPCATPAYTLAQASAGDTIYFDNASTWDASSGQVLNLTTANITANGSSWGTGTRAKLTSSGTVDAVAKISASGITFTGFEIDMLDQIAGGIYIGSYATASIADITVSNCVVHGSRLPTGNYRYGIHVGGYATAYVGVDTVLIKDTEVYNTGHEGIAIYPTWTRYGCSASNITVRNCYIHSTGLDGDSWGKGIAVVNNSSNVLAEYNVIDACDIGFGISSSSDAGKWMGTPSDVTFRYNLVSNSVVTNITISNYWDTVCSLYIYGNLLINGLVGITVGDDDLTTSTVYIYNNTINQDSGYGLGVYFMNASGTGANKVQFKNNIVYHNGGPTSSGSYTPIKFSTGALDHIEHTNNIIYRASSASHAHYLIAGTSYYRADVIATLD